MTWRTRNGTQPFVWNHMEKPAQWGERHFRKSSCVGLNLFFSNESLRTFSDFWGPAPVVSIIKFSEPGQPQRLVAAHRAVRHLVGAFAGAGMLVNAHLTKTVPARCLGHVVFCLGRPCGFRFLLQGPSNCCSWDKRLQADAAKGPVAVHIFFRPGLRHMMQCGRCCWCVCVFRS